MSLWVRRAVALSSALVGFVAVPAAEGGVNVWSRHPASDVGSDPGPVFALAIDPVTHSTIYAGTRCYGAFKSDNGGPWTALNNDDFADGCIEAIVPDPSEPGTLYVGTGDGTVFKTTDRGDTWSATGIPANLLTLAIASTPTTLYAGTYKAGVFKYAEDGEGWTSIGLIPEEVFTLAIDPITPTTLYAGSGSGVFRSLDGGATWSPGLMGLEVRALMINPATPSTLYAATPAGLSLSLDGGNSWSATGLSDSTIALAIDPITPTTLYAATTTGVAKSTDAGATWRDLSAGLPVNNRGERRYVFELDVDPQMPTRVYAGTTDGRGVFSIEQVSECASDCNDNDQVTVDEILAAVAIALGHVALSTCVAGDADGDGTVTVDEITVAVHNGLSGCPPRSTPTPTVTVTPTPTSNCVTALTGLQYASLFGGPGCIDVAAPAECCWEATSGGLSITSGSSGCGDGRICFEVPVWNCYLPFDRTCRYEIAAGGKTFQIYQSGPGTPPATLSPTRTPTPTGPTPSSTETVPPTPTPTVTSTGTPAVGVFAYVKEYALAVRVIDTADNRDVITVPIPLEGTVLPDIVASPDGKHVYVLSPYRVFVIDTTYNVVLETFPLPHQTDRIALSPSGELLFASSAAEDELDVIQTVDGTVTAHIPVPGLYSYSASDVVVTSDGARAYVATRPKSVSIIDLVAHSVVGTIALDAQPVTLVISPDEDVLYVSTELETVGIEIIDTATRRLRGNVPLAYPAGALAIAPDGRLIFSTHPTADSVSIIDTQAGEVLRTLPVGDRPSDIAVTPDGNWAYVINPGFFAYSASVSVIDTRTLEVAQTLPSSDGDRVAIVRLP